MTATVVPVAVEQPAIESSAVASHGRYEALDGVRAVAVAFVLFHHTWGLGGAPPLNADILGFSIPFGAMLQGAGLGVDIFFVLSGFLLSLPWHRAELGGRRSPLVSSYFRRRLLRIVPPYWVCVGLCLLLLYPSVVAWGSLHTPDGRFSVFAHALFAQQLFPLSASGFGIFGSLWTLTIEMIFYIVLPFSIGLFLRRRWMVTVPVCIAISFLWLWATRNSLDWLVDRLVRSMSRYGTQEFNIRGPFLANQFPTFLGDFALGITAARLAVARELGIVPVRLRRLLDSGAAMAALFVVGWTIVLWALHLNGTQTAGELLPYYGDHLIAAFGTTLVIISTLRATSGAARVSAFAPLRGLGIIGYSVFLWHMPIIYVMNQYPFMSTLPPVDHFVQLTIRVVPAVIVLSIVFFHLVERPFMGGRWPFGAKSTT